MEPVLQRGAPLTYRKGSNALADFPDGHDAQEYAFLVDVSEKLHYACIGVFASEFRRDIRVNQIALHRLISRPVSLSRSKSRLRPRRGANSSTMSFAIADGACVTDTSR